MAKSPKKPAPKKGGAKKCSPKKAVKRKPIPTQVTEREVRERILKNGHAVGKSEAAEAVLKPADGATIFGGSIKHPTVEEQWSDYKGISARFAERTARLTASVMSGVNLAPLAYDPPAPKPSLLRRALNRVKRAFRFRSAKTEEFVSQAEAEASPDTTVRERGEVVQVGCWAIAAVLALIVMLVAGDFGVMFGAMLAAFCCAGRALFWADRTRVRQRTRADGWPV